MLPGSANGGPNGAEVGAKERLVKPARAAFGI